MKIENRADALLRQGVLPVSRGLIPSTALIRSGAENPFLPLYQNRKANFAYLSDNFTVFCIFFLTFSPYRLIMFTIDGMNMDGVNQWTVLTY